MKMKVNPHAIFMFRQRTECKKPDDRIRDTILGMFGNAKKACFIHPEYAVKALLNHRFEKADYFLMHDWVFVVIDTPEGKEIKTIYQNEYKRLITA